MQEQDALDLYDQKVPKGYKSALAAHRAGIEEQLYNNKILASGGGGQGGGAAQPRMTDEQRIEQLANLSPTELQKRIGKASPEDQKQIMADIQAFKGGGRTPTDNSYQPTPMQPEMAGRGQGEPRMLSKEEPNWGGQPGMMRGR